VLEHEQQQQQEGSHVKPSDPITPPRANWSDSFRVTCNEAEWREQPPNLLYDQFPEIPRPITGMPAGKDPTTDARILLMLNMVTADDLNDDVDYGDLYKDVREECSNYGEVENFKLKIPRPVKKTNLNGLLQIADR
jgi:hypothetical protein